MKSRAMGLLFAAAFAFVAMASIAQADTPHKGYERFAGCPGPTENPEVFLCQKAVIDGGHFQMGSKDVPITEPMTLVGGVGFDGRVWANSKGGLSQAKQKVPGGVIGLTGLTWLLEFLGSEALTLYAVTEIAGQPTVKAGSTILNLPIRVHLINSALGNNCYVGGFTNPIKLTLIFGTTSPPAPNKPITGTAPVEGTSDLEETLKLEKGVLVDNSFSAPGASGCVLTLFGFIPISINGLVNTQSGLPAAAGTNETKQNLATLEVAAQETVYAP